MAGGGSRNIAIQAEAEQQSPDDLVMGTNSSSIVSKRSVERLYYPNEPHFFRFFVKKFQRRAPLINRGYLLRLKVIDTVVRRFLEHSSPLKKVVVNLGCGSDVLPWQCHARYPDLSKDALFVDVDFPDLIRKKRDVVLAAPELRSLLGSFEIGEDNSPILLKSERYCQVGCDLRQLALLKETLSSLVGVATTEATFLFVAEVSITYLETSAADDVIEWASTLGNTKFCILEQILPDGQDNPFARTMLAHFDKLKTSLRSVLQYPTVESQETRFRDKGWPSIQSWTLWEAWADDAFMSAAERRALDVVEPFDEWEELALFASHYIVVVASSDATANPLAENRARSHAEFAPSKVYEASAEITESLPGRMQRRFGAAMLCEDVQGRPFVSHLMGHGPRSRLSSCDVYQVADGLELATFRPGGPTARVCHTLTDMGTLGTLLVGGRTSPSSPMADCWLYRKGLNRWERVQDLPAPLFRHSVIRLGHSSLALVVGGRVDHCVSSQDFYVYHPQEGWLTCQVDGQAPAIFGAIIAEIEAESIGCYEGLIAGGVLEDGVLNEQTFHWALSFVEGCPKIKLNICVDEIPNKESRIPLLSRVGAHCIQHGRFHLLLGGVTPRHQLPQDHDILVLKAGASGFTVIASLDSRDTSGPLRPFLIGASVVSHPNGRISILGGGATCFSMGTCWGKGVYSIYANIGDLHRQEAELAKRTPLRYLRTIDVVPVLDKHHATPSSEPANVMAVPRLKIDSAADFKILLEKGRPAVIEGADIGSCVNRWTPEYLVGKVGADHMVSIHMADSERMDFNAKNFTYLTTTFKRFVDDAQAQQRVYLRALSAAEPSNVAANLATDYPSLAPDFQLPEQLKFVSENLHSSILRISGPVNMWLHYDVMANVYVQIKGSKRLVLFPPRDVTQLGFAPGASSSSLDVFTALERRDLYNVQSHVANVRQGDILFIPPLWLHTAKPTEGLSTAVNVFFRSLETGYAMGRDVYGNRDLAAYEKGRQDIQKIAASLAKLPKDTAGFYARRLADELHQIAAD